MRELPPGRVHARAGWPRAAYASVLAGTGISPVRNPSVLGRCMRDILVANSHMLFDPKTLTDAGPVVVKRWTAGHAQEPVVGTLQ